MTEISAGLVKELRDLTGAGMMDCKRTLQETDGDLDAACFGNPDQGPLASAGPAEDRKTPARSVGAPAGQV